MKRQRLNRGLNWLSLQSRCKDYEMWANTKKNDLAEDITSDNISADVLEAQHEELKVCCDCDYVTTLFCFLYIRIILNINGKLTKKIQNFSMRFELEMKTWTNCSMNVNSCLTQIINLLKISKIRLQKEIYIVNSSCDAFQHGCFYLYSQ